MVYQMMFAVISPALITGAFAERVKFNALLVYSILWAFFVYFPVAHMVWGQGGYLNAFSGGAIPVLDFAGGTVVHITTGISALVCAMVIGPRRGYPQEPMKPHSLVLSFIGACLLWVGWFGFNAAAPWPPPPSPPALSSPPTWLRPPERSPGSLRSAGTTAVPVRLAPFQARWPASPP